MSILGHTWLRLFNDGRSANDFICLTCGTGRPATAKEKRHEKQSKNGPGLSGFGRYDK